MQTNYETRGVLGGAYRGKGIDQTLLTHLCEVNADGFETKVICRGVKLDSICDQAAYTAQELASKPTCPRCAARWEKLHLAP